MIARPHRSSAPILNRCAVMGILMLGTIVTERSTAQVNPVHNIIDRNYEYVENLYKHFHAHPELSLQEAGTSARLAEELRRLGFDVTENIGGYGVVAVLRNGAGPTVMVRTDLDALPIEEETDAPFKSSTKAIDGKGDSVSVMHACGHDMHMSVLVGTARVMTELSTTWQGTLVLVGQPAEEPFSGSEAMLKDGLFERFPRPDIVLALHVNSAMASGTVGYTLGLRNAGVDEAQIVVRGRGGHGAYPDLTVDPVILASKLVLDLQTIVSRNISALHPAVISVGSIHGGTSANIIPNEVKLDLLLTSYDSETRGKLIENIELRCEGVGRSAGLTREEWPRLVLGKHVPPLYNDPDLSARLARVFKGVFGESVIEERPTLYGEDFARYGRVDPATKISMFSLGSQRPEEMAAAEKGLINLPSTHSSRFLPDLQPTLETGILAMSSALVNLLSSDS